MKISMFILFLTISFTLNAKTEAGLNLPGAGKKSQSRNIAQATNDALGALSQLGNMNQPRPKTQALGSFFGDNSGALTKKRAPAKEKKSNSTNK